MFFLEILKAILFGVVEGVTEWLPISSTGHLILLDEVLSLAVSPEFYEMLSVVVQLGAILAVLVLYGRRLCPIGASRHETRGIYRLWGLTLLGVLPSATIGLILDDWLDEHFYNYTTVAAMLIVYGIAFIIVERAKKKSADAVCELSELTPRTALLVGLFQALALIPGTSRSGATILGGYICGLSRSVSAEFSFFLAIPTMAGAGALKTVKFIAEGNALTASELAILAASTVAAFLVSLAVIKFLTGFVREHSFLGFGVYRIILGGAVILYYLCK